MGRFYSIDYILRRFQFITDGIRHNVQTVIVQLLYQVKNSVEYVRILKRNTKNRPDNKFAKLRFNPKHVKNLNHTKAMIIALYENFHLKNVNGLVLILVDHSKSKTYPYSSAVRWSGRYRLDNFVLWYRFQS